MLIWRLIVGSILVAALAGLFYWDAHSGPAAPVLLFLVTFLAFLAANEMTDLLWTRSFRPSRILVICCSILIAASSWYGRFVVMPIFVAPDDNTLTQVALTYSISVLLLLAHAAYRYREPGKSMETLGAELLIVSYVGVLLGVLSQLRWVAGGAAGYLVLGSLVVVVKAGDIGAYTLGRLFGKRKMVPLLSPGKTWMGGVGALAGSVLGAMAWFQWATPLFDPAWAIPPIWCSIIYGLVLGVVGLIGDLCESLIKRDVGKKDSSVLLPGFGGLLDLLDSVLYAGPIAYILWKGLPIKSW